MEWLLMNTETYKDLLHKAKTHRGTEYALDMACWLVDAFQEKKKEKEIIPTKIVPNIISKITPPKIRLTKKQWQSKIVNLLKHYSKLKTREITSLLKSNYSTVHGQLVRLENEGVILKEEKNLKSYGLQWKLTTEYCPSVVIEKDMRDN